MTSSISFYKLLKEDVKKRIWLFWLFVALFLVVLPIVAAMQIDSVLSWSADDMKYVREWFVESVIGNGWMGAFIIVGAIVSAISSFANLHVREQVDFYHSLPIRREQWFAVNYASSFVQIMIPCICGHIIRYIIGVVKGVASPESIKALVFILGISLVCYHLAYAVSAVGMIITGRMLTGILMILFLQLWGAFVLYLKEMVMGTAFQTYLSTSEITGMETIGPYLVSGWIWEKSPLFLYRRVFRMYLEKENLFPIIGLALLLGVLVIGLAILLYKIRPSEAAGKSVAFPILEPVIKVLVSVSVGLFFVYLAASQYEVTEKFPVWLFVIGIFANIFVCVVIEFVYSADMKMMFKRKISFGISILITVILCVVLRFDMIGYDSYLPEKKEIAEMSVDLLYNNLEMFGSSEVFAEEKVEEEMGKLRTEEFDRIYKVAQNGIGYAKKDMDQWDGEKYVPVKVAYYLKSGRTVYRKYLVDHMEIYQCMDALFADREYRRKYFDLEQFEREKYNLSSVNMYMGTYHMFKPDDKNLDNLLEIYLEELEIAPFSVFENANLVAQFQFSNGEEFVEFPVYEEFTKTLEFLQEKFIKFRKLTSDDISFITAEYVETGSSDGELVKKMIERKDIQQILDNVCYVSTGFLGRIAEPDLYITIETTTGQMYNYYIRKGQVPECLAER